MTIADATPGRGAGALEIRVEGPNGRGWIALAATLGGEEVLRMSVRPADRAGLDDFVGRLSERCRARGLQPQPGRIASLVADAVAARRPGPSSRGEGGPQGYVALLDGAGAPCLARVQGESLIPLTNFVARVVRRIVLDDEGVTGRRIAVEVIGRGKDRSEVELDEAEYADANRLEHALIGLGHGLFRVECHNRELRNAIAGVSDDEVPELTLTAAHGWAGPDRSAYLTNGGLVTADGYRPYGDDDPIRLAPVEAPGADRLGLARLEPDGLRRVAAHLAGEFSRLHAPRLMLSLLGLPALAVLEPFADATERPAFLLRGATGAGKSFLLRLLARFFMAPGADDRHIPASWSGTANALESGGHDFRGAIYGIDDYKREMVGDRDAIRIHQAYSQWAGRARLRRDASHNPSRWIRGLLVSTGESLPDGAASMRARIVVLDVPDGAKEQELGASCLRHRGEFSGLMAAFIADVIRNGRGRSFARRYEEIRADLRRVAGTRENADRIASNLALLGAAVAAMVDFFCQVTGDDALRDVLTSYLEDDLPGLLAVMFEATEQERSTTLFLETLSHLIAKGEVAIQGAEGPRLSLASFESGPGGRQIGRLFGHVVGISVPNSVDAVNRSFVGQQRKPLRPNDVLAALHHDGLLREEDGSPLPADAEEKTFQRRVDGWSNSVRLAFLDRRTLGFERG